MAPKKGRRASPKNDSTLTSDSEVPPQARKLGGWADDALKNKKPKSHNILEQQRFLEQSKEDIYDKIPEIPDSDDFTESLNSPVARAPTLAVNRTETYSEINQDLIKNSLIKELGDADYSILLESLASEEQLKAFRSEDPFTIESLFADLSEDYYKNILKE